MNKHCCHKCGRKYKMKQALYQHLRFECGKEPQFFCPVSGCSFKAKLKGNLTKHVKGKHFLI